MIASPFNDPAHPLYDPPVRRNFHLVKYDLAPFMLPQRQRPAFLDFMPEPSKHQSIRNAVSAFGKRNHLRLSVSTLSNGAMRVTTL